MSGLEAPQGLSDRGTEAAARVEGRKRLASGYWEEDGLVQKISAGIVQGC